MLVLLALMLGAPAASAAGGCAPGWSNVGGNQCGLTVNYTGSSQTVTIPSGVTQVEIGAYGAAGGGAPYDTSSPPDSDGGFGAGFLTVTPGEQLTVLAGGAGSIVKNAAAGVGGYGGGGNGGKGGVSGENGVFGGGGGGGGTFIWGPAGSLLLAAGGGGGANGEQNSGGDGGIGHGTAGDGGTGNSGASPPACDGLPNCYPSVGFGATATGGGDPGQGTSSSGVVDATAGKGPATGPGSFGKGGTGGFASDGASMGGGGGGGGYFGGGGGAYVDDCCTISGGGGGSGYFSPQLTDTTGALGGGAQSENYPDDNGYARFLYTSSSTQVTGTIVTAFGDGWGAANLVLTGTDSSTGQPVTMTATTNSNGDYSFNVDPGTYTVTPSPAVPGSASAGPNEFTTTACPGTTGPGNCSSITVKADQVQSVNFTAQYTLTGKVTGTDGNGVPGATVLVQDTEQGVLKKTSVMTAGDGTFNVKLAPGSVTASVDPLSGSQFFPVPGSSDPDCMTSNVSCQVNLNQDRSVAFTACVVPDPSGAPLPANTPDPIPGAVEAPPLEAVGCWTPQNGPNPGVYSSTQPVRLDGVDLNPSPGTTITLNTSVPTVTTDGPAQVMVDGYGVTYPIPLSLAYQGGVAAAGSSVLSVQDLGSGSGPAAIGASLFGIPISLGTGGPLGFGMPFIESTGQTQINLATQFVLPLDTRGSWNFLQGKFLDENGDGVPSIGLSGQINLTNRNGIQAGQVCGSLNDWKPFGEEAGEISGLQVCWSPTQHQLSGLGMFELPTAAQKIVRDVYVQVTLQQAKNSAGVLQGYQLAAAQIEFDHLNSTSIPVEPGASSLDVKESGIPIGLGIYLQDLRAGFYNNLAGTNSKTYFTDPLIVQVLNALANPLAGTVSNVYGGIGLSLGPEVVAAGVPVNLFRLDGTVSIMPPQGTGNPNDNWVYQASVKGTFARLSPIELQIGNASLTYHASSTAPEADFQGDIGTPSNSSFWSIIGGYHSSLRGVINNNVGNLFEGVESLKVGSLTGSKDVLIWLNPFKKQATVAACLSLNNVTVGFDYNAITGQYDGYCNMGAFKHPTLNPSAISSSVRRTSLPVGVRLPRGKTAVELAIRGRRAAPKLTLVHGHERITVRAGSKPQLSRRALILTDRKHHTVYVTLLHPPGGKWVLRPRHGSTITSVLDSTPLPQARIKSHVVRHGCAESLSYRVKQARGERVILYAQVGNHRVVLGNAKGRGGSYKIPPLAGASGGGQIVAFFARGGKPAGTATVAKFHQPASCAGT